jgi:Leucine-rich repeat (LRR) protein
MRKNLEELVLNSNPLKELPASLANLENLKIIGISYTLVPDINQNIIHMPNLVQLNCFNAKIRDPPEDVANRGLAAMKDYFQKNKKDDEDEKNQETGGQEDGEYMSDGEDFDGDPN